jgi:MoaA/NifB/PqqE/SkfB family radical SAM enzyme
MNWIHTRKNYYLNIRREYNMQARISPGYDSQRKKLSEIIPIPTPFTLFITPAQVCNFRCFYCTQHKSRNEKKRLGFQSQLLDYEVFLKIASQAAEFPEPFRRVLLTGLGEPLMNPRIPEMVATLKRRGVADRYEIFTNAYLLSHDMSDRLLAAGLTRLRISIQGLSAEKYREVCGVDIEFDRLLDNIRYFYEHRGDCTVYLKIIDAGLAGKEDEEKFYSLFGDICDDIYIEHLVKAQPSMGDYENRADNYLTFYGERSQKRDVCPYMFYTLQTDATGNVFPCPPLGLPVMFSLGNINKITLREIWNGDKLRALRLSHLHKNRDCVPVCDTCEHYLCFTPDEDNLDNDTEMLIEKIRRG